MTGRSSLRFRTLHMVALACALFMPAAAQAATCSVTSTADSGAGTLRDALANSTCDTINFVGLTLPATITLTSGELVVDRSVTISGPGASQLTVMRSSEASPFRIVRITTGTAAIGGLTIANGFDLNSFVGAGGGILVESAATLALSNSIVSGNTSKFVVPGFGTASGGKGGGIASWGALAVTNSTVSGNDTCGNDACNSVGSGSGGGIYSYAGTLTLTGSRVSNNRSGVVGGGIVSFVGATLTGSTVSGNWAWSDGGGMYLLGSNATISGSTISGNATLAGGGGGIYFDGLSSVDIEVANTLTLVNSSVVGNAACSGGCTSGVVNHFGIMNITNTTFSGNVSPVFEMFTETVYMNEGGPGRTRITHSTFAGNTGTRPTIAGYVDLPQPDLFVVRNNIFADTAGPTCDQGPAWPLPITDGGFNLERGSSCGFSAAGSQSNVDPMLGALEDNDGPTRTHALLDGSPAIDTGTCTNIQNNSVTTDQRGVARPQGATCDIGAYELQPAPRPVFTGFFAPVANAPAANFVKAGQAIPIKFSLGGDFGLNVIAGSPGSQQVACTLSPATSVITDTMSAGNSGLTYDRATQTYTYVWKTDKSWANTCRRLTIGFSDSGVGIKTAEFTFTK